MQVFADGFTQVSLSGGVIRLNLVQTNAENQTTDVGQLLIPAVRAEAFLNGMANAFKQLSEQAKQANQQAASSAPNQESNDQSVFNS